MISPFAPNSLRSSLRKLRRFAESLLSIELHPIPCFPGYSQSFWYRQSQKRRPDSSLVAPSNQRRQEARNSPRSTPLKPYLSENA